MRYSTPHLYLMAVVMSFIAVLLFLMIPKQSLAHTDQPGFIEVAESNLILSLPVDWMAHLPGNFNPILELLTESVEKSKTSDEQLEINRLIETIGEYFLLSFDGRDCEFIPKTVSEESRGLGKYLRFEFNSSCEINHSGAELEFIPFSQGIPYTLWLQLPGDKLPTRITEIESIHTFASLKPSYFESAAVMVGEGIYHILIGWDHVLFLLGLVALYVYAASQYSNSFKSCAKKSLQLLVPLITLFTIAHSITLAVAALGLFVPSAGLVELVIAMTVVLSGLHLMKSTTTKYMYSIIMIVGLLHGFGFSNVLAELTVKEEGYVMGLLAFNVGIEIGQLLLILFLLPILVFISLNSLIANVFRKILVTGLMVLGSFWTLQRILYL